MISQKRGEFQCFDGVYVVVAEPLASEYVDKRRKRQAERSRSEFAKASDIGEIPAVVNSTRKALCKYDLHLFEQVYFPHSTGLGPFGAPQTNVLARIEEAILKSGRVLNCEPRGFAKSTKSENALLWAALYGHRSYGVLFGATGDDADDAIGSIKTELQENDLLYEDFPEVCHAIRALEGRPQRCQTQTYNGDLTHIGWTADSVVLPTIPGSASSGAILRSKGYTAASRGMRFKRPDGRQVRPDLVIVDDPQTDESAISPAQVAKRMNLLNKSILRLGGHGRKVSAIMNATVIADGDMVDQLADHKQHPEWQAVRVKMLPKMPDRFEDLWLTEYAKLRRDYDPDDIGDQQRAHRRATKFYLDNRDVMDAGSEVAWHHIPLEDGEVSPLQHAMNIIIDDGEDVFASECQNEPRRAIPAGLSVISADDVKTRYSGFERAVVSDRASHVVFHCDVHDAILYWTVAAVQSDFSGHVLDYGTFPEQPNPWFSMYSLKRKLQDVLGTDSVEEAIAEGVRHVANDLCGRSWTTESGEILPVSCGLFDIGYKPEEVASGIRTSEHSAVLRGSRGIGIGPVEKPMVEYDVSPKRARSAGPDRKRPRWYVPRETIDGLQIVRFDANYWKSVTASRFMQPRHTPGAWSLFGNHRTDHGHFVDHLTAEEPVPTTAKGRTVVVFKAKPNRENHWWDNTIGCVLAASLLGTALPGKPIDDQRPKPPPQPPRRPQPGNMIRRHDGLPFFVTAR